MDRSTELLDCTPTSLDAATKIMDFLHASMPKTEVLNQVTESLDSATEEMNGATGEPDQGAKIMDASAKELEPTAENLDIDVWRMPRSLGFIRGKSGFHPRIFLDIALSGLKRLLAFSRTVSKVRRW